MAAWLPMQGRRRPAARLAGGALLLAAGAALRSQLGFAVVPTSGAARNAGPWVAASPGERLDVPRGEATPRTQMLGRYAEGGRSRQNNQGGGRLPIRMARRPVLAYADGEENEPGGSVLRRMWDMYDMDFNRMVSTRQRYFRLRARRNRWTADYNMRSGARRKELRIKRQYELDWQDWMRREGRRKGLTDPIIYDGPPLAYKMPKGGELDRETDIENVRKQLPSQDEIGQLVKKAPKGMALIPEDMHAGKWNTDGQDNIFKIWRRPLHKWPYDIGKRGKIGPVVRGIVM